MNSNNILSSLLPLDNGASALSSLRRDPIAEELLMPYSKFPKGIPHGIGVLICWVPTDLYFLHIFSILLPEVNCQVAVLLFQVLFQLHPTKVILVLLFVSFELLRIV